MRQPTEPLIVDVEASGSVYPSKRSGYFDISGVVRFSTRNDSILTLDSSDYRDDPLVISISSGRENWIITDNGDYFDVTCRTRDINNYKVKACLQSEITHLFLNEILLSGTCSLPTIAQSTLHHIKVFEFIGKLLSNGGNYQISQEFTFT